MSLKSPKQSLMTKSILGLILPLKDVTVIFNKKEKPRKHSYICSDGSLLQSICVCVEGKFGPVGSLLILTIYKTSVHSQTFMHRQEKTKRSTSSYTNIQVVNKSLFFCFFFYQRGV